MSDMIFLPIGNGGLFNVPNMVVDRFLNEADDTALRVILYYFRKGGGFTLEEICSYLSVTPAAVEKSINFWLASGVLMRTASGIMPNMNAIVFDSHPAEKTHAKKPSYEFREISQAITENKPLYALIQSVQSMFSRALSPEAIKTIYSFYDYYGMPTEVIYKLISFCTSSGKENIRYIEQVAHSWYTAGINTEERAHEYVEKYQRSKERESAVKRIFGIDSRNLSSKEKEYIRKWTESYLFSDDMIKFAFDKAVDSTGKAGFAYIDKILYSWFEKGYKAPDEVVDDKPQKKAPAKKGRGKTGESTFSAEEFAKWEFMNTYGKKEGE